MRTFQQPLPDDVIALHLPKDITDVEIDELIRSVMPEVIKREQGCVCCFYGYEFDDRELFEIPEAIEKCKRLVERGFISMMYVCTLLKKEDKPYLAKKFGAFEVWSLANGHVNKEGDVPVEVWEQFWKDLGKANKTAYDLLNPKIVDGQHRTGVSQ